MEAITKIVIAVMVPLSTAVVILQNQGKLIYVGVILNIVALTAIGFILTGILKAATMVLGYKRVKKKKLWRRLKHYD